MKNQQVKFERKIEELIKSVNALQVGCEECKGPHLTKDCPNRDYQWWWNNNCNFNQRPPGFFAPNQQNQRTEGEPRVSIEDRLIQFMSDQKKINDEVGSYLRNHQSTIQNLEMQVGRISQMLSERTQGEQPMQTQVNPKVDNAKPMLMLPLILCCGFSEGLVEPFAEPERKLKKKNKKKSKAGKVRPRALNFDMGEEAPMWNTQRTGPTVPTQPITKPNLETEIKGQFLHMVKELTFDGKSDSNPIVHIASFEEICDLFRTKNNRDAIRLRGQGLASFLGTEFDCHLVDLRSKFLSRFFPLSKIEKLRAEIRLFRQEDEETFSEAWERFKHLLHSCPSHRLNKSDQVQTFYSGLNYSSRGTLDSSAGGVFMYKTPTQGYTLLEDMLFHNIDWESDKRLQIPKLAGKISTDFDPSEELAAMKNKQVRFERKINELIKNVHALQVRCEECKGPHLTKDCPNKPMMTPKEVNFLNRGDYQGRWNNNRNFNQRPPGFFAPNQQNQRMDGEPRMSLEDRLFQFMESQKKLNEEVSSYLRNQQSVIENLELQVGQISQTLSRRTQGELPTQTQVSPKVDASKTILMVDGVTTKKAWTYIYTKKYIPSDYD
ncbi:hypothetical protein OSB04_028423 [Centaurea solstitialis]|uniref:Retrotransposon gag domain-containing protein n=1 Tax=Centaurea solstitialis TaxID=347529 RepID=A0AA38SZ85_9ASTR|nr:hypothetical protein OSB04_028423 [Centaurea solstitialis]